MKTDNLNYAMIKGLYFKLHSLSSRYEIILYETLLRHVQSILLHLAYGYYVGMFWLLRSLDNQERGLIHSQVSTFIGVYSSEHNSTGRDFVQRIIGLVFDFKMFKL